MERGGVEIDFGPNRLSELGGAGQRLGRETIRPAERFYANLESDRQRDAVQGARSAVTNLLGRVSSTSKVADRLGA